MVGYPPSPYPPSTQCSYPPPSSTYPPPPPPYPYPSPFSAVVPPPPPPQQPYPYPSPFSAVVPSPPPPQQPYPYPSPFSAVVPSPPHEKQPYPYPSPFSIVVPSPLEFPPGTDPNAVACFFIADEDRDGIISDKELQKALSVYGHNFNARTIHLLLSLYTTNITRIGPKEFVPLYNNLQIWKAIFEKFDTNHTGRIDASELGQALWYNGYNVSPAALQLLVSKFGQGFGNCKAIEYSNFIECFLTVKALTDKFKEKDVALTGCATFTYVSFLLTVIPFLKV